MRRNSIVKSCRYRYGKSASTNGSAESWCFADRELRQPTLLLYFNCFCWLPTSADSITSIELSPEFPIPIWNSSWSCAALAYSCQKFIYTYAHFHNCMHRCKLCIYPYLSIYVYIHAHLYAHICVDIHRERYIYVSLAHT